jgi:hypothetical protein
MTQNIFFSWQSDIPPCVGRNFLKEILEEVCNGIASDTNIDEALRDLGVDSDTQGVAGQPPIVETIFKKIDKSSVFIADMTFVGARTDGRLTPNPNVLIEYGWALKGLGYERVICVMNTAYGKPTSDNLPFDLSHVRWPIQYSLADNSTTEIKTEERQKLFTIFDKAIRASLSTIQIPTAETKDTSLVVIAKDGPARFRGHGEALGFNDDFSSSEEHKEVFLSTGPAIWLRLMPVNNPKKIWPAHELKNFAIKNNKMNLTPLLNGSGGYSHLRAEDGVGIFKTSPQKNNDSNSIEVDSIAFAFETGEIWSIDTAWLSFDDKRLPFVEKYYIDRIQDYTRFLKDLGIQPPYKWIAGMVGIKSRRFNYPVQEGFYRHGQGPICSTDSIEVEGQYDDKQNTETALMPFFKKIFEKCGLPRPDYLSQ